MKADLRPANSPVVLRIFDLGHGEEISAPDPCPPVFPCCTGQKNIQASLRFHADETSQFNDENISHMIQKSDPSMTKCHQSDYITPETF